MVRFLKGLCISARPAVIPSLFSNLVLGFCLGNGLSVPQENFPIGAVAGIFALYLYGMWGNDFADAQWDMRHRALRPVPMGMISRKGLGWGVLVSLVIGGVFLWDWKEAAGLLFLCISVYNITHKRWVFSPLFMGGCRALLLYLAATVAGGENHVFLYPAMIVLFLYVSGVTWWAREEHKYPERIPVVGRLLSWMPLLDAAWLLAAGMSIPAVFCLGCFLASRLIRKLGGRAS